MTTASRRAVQITGGVTLATLMMFGDWVIEKTRHQNDVPEVSEVRFVRDSVAVRADLNQVLMELRQTNLQLTETNQRLREVCVVLRAGCR